MPTQIQDIIDVTVFQDLPAVNSPEKTALLESGAVVKSPLLDGIANAPGRIAELPFWNDLDETNTPNLSDDDPANVAVPDIVTQGEQITRKAYLNQGWSKTDLASEMAMGPKVMEQIRARVDRYWDRQWQRRIISSFVGVLADNVANDNGDMVVDVAAATNGDVDATTVFTRQNFTSAAFTLGDAVDGIAGIAVHSVVKKSMVDAGDIITIRPQDGSMEYDTYLGKRVIVDDSLPFTPAGGGAAGDPAPRYTSVLFGPGIVGYGEGTPDVPVEVQRIADQANGGGVETLWVRKTWIVHPFGFAVVANPAAVSFSLAELQDADTWDRVVARKNVPLAFLVTNG